MQQKDRRKDRSANGENVAKMRKMNKWAILQIKVNCFIRVNTALLLETKNENTRNEPKLEKMRLIKLMHT